MIEIRKTQVEDRMKITNFQLSKDEIKLLK